MSTAFDFYTRVLGFAAKLRMPEYDLAIVVSPEDPDGTALLLEPNGNPIATQYQAALRTAQLPVIVFAVNDVHAEHAQLTATGVQFLQEPTTTPWRTQAMLDDTCGNYVQLHQATWAGWPGWPGRGRPDLKVRPYVPEGPALRTLRSGPTYPQVRP